MSNDKTAATGYENVRPHEGWESLAAWGRTGEVPPPDDMMEATGTSPAPPKRTPIWLWAGLVVLAWLLACAGIFAFFPTADPPARPVTPGPLTALPLTSQVLLSGECQKQIIGHYGLIATVTATNYTGVTQTGTIWVRWPVTGDEDQVFVKTFTIAANGGTADFRVNQEIDSDLWFRTGQCSYVWKAS